MALAGEQVKGFRQGLSGRQTEKLVMSQGEPKRRPGIKDRPESQFGSGHIILLSLKALAAMWCKTRQILGLSWKEEGQG